MYSLILFLGLPQAEIARPKHDGRAADSFFVSNGQGEAEREPRRAGGNASEGTAIPQELYAEFKVINVKKGQWVCAF